MTEALLALVARIRAVEYRLATAEQERVATALLKGQIHALGNALQIVDLASAELVRRGLADEDNLIGDLRSSATEARTCLAAMVAVSRPASRATPGPAVAPILVATIAELRAVVPAIELASTLRATTASRLGADEVDALVLAAALDAAAAPHLRFTVRERTIAGARWIELVRFDDRPGNLELVLEPPALAGVVERIANLVNGEVSLAPVRDGHELAIALPAA